MEVNVYVDTNIGALIGAIKKNRNDNNNNNRNKLAQKKYHDFNLIIALEIKILEC